MPRSSQHQPSSALDDTVDLSKIITRLSKQKARYSDSLLQPCIPVTIDQTTFYVHEQILRRGSNYMATALDSRFEEGIEKKILLPNEDVALFRYFLRWLYKGSPKTLNSIGFSVELLTDFVRLYTLGDRLQAGDFKEFICECLSERWSATRSIGPGDDESIPDLIDAVEILLDEMPEVETDKMQRWLLGLFGSRRTDPKGWQQSVYFRRKLKENSKMEAGLTSPLRLKMMSELPIPEIRALKGIPKTIYEHELS